MVDDAPWAEGGLNHALIGDLIDEMGSAATEGFLHRALAEASALPRVPGPALAPRVHAVIGACGMTGLVGVELALRALLAALHSGQPGAPERAVLDGAITAAQQALPERFPVPRHQNTARAG